MPTDKRNTIPNRAAYPRAFITPGGRAVSVRTMANALRAISRNPGADYPGWTWHTVPGYFIQNAVRRGIHDRINLRAQL